MNQPITDANSAVLPAVPMIRCNKPPRQVSSGGLTFIMHAECKGGLPSLKAYLDSKGIPTIGVGHTAGVYLGMVCDTQQALAWFDDDLDEAEYAVCKLVTVPLTTNQFDALVSLVFNIGVPEFTTSTLLRLLNQGNYVAASAQFAAWNKLVTYPKGVKLVQVSKGLTNRRGLEAALFNTKDSPSAPPARSPLLTREPITVALTMPAVHIGNIPMANEVPQPPPQTVAASPGGKTGIAALLTGGAGAIASGYQQVAPVIHAVQRIADDTATMGAYLRVFAVVLALGSIGFMGWSLWKQRQAARA